MAVGLRTGPDVLYVGTLRHLGSANHEGHDATAVHQHEPADRPREDKVPFPVFEVGVPAHLLGKRQVAQQTAHHFRQHIDGGLAALVHPIGQVHALRRLMFLQRGHIHAVLPGKPDGGSGGLTTRLVGRRERRARHQLLEIRLALGKLGHRAVSRLGVL